MRIDTDSCGWIGRKGSSAGKDVGSKYPVLYVSAVSTNTRTKELASCVSHVLATGQLG